MDTSEYLLRAYTQDHIGDVDVFLAYVKNFFGEGELYQIHKFMCKKYGTPKLGTSRVTYLSKFVVFKIPISEDGFGMNDFEASLMGFGEEQDPWYIPLAKSKHLPQCGMPIVVMEKVIPADNEMILSIMGTIPSFVNSVDMGQVGFTKSGKLVAFDYADLL